MYTLMITAGGAFCSLYASENEYTVIKIRDRLVDMIHDVLERFNPDRDDAEKCSVMIYNNCKTILNDNYNIQLSLHQSQVLLDCIRIVVKHMPISENIFKIYTAISTISVVNEGD